MKFIVCIRIYTEWTILYTFEKSYPRLTLCFSPDKIPGESMIEIESSTGLFICEHCNLNSLRVISKAFLPLNRPLNQWYHVIFELEWQITLTESCFQRKKGLWRVSSYQLLGHFQGLFPHLCFPLIDLDHPKLLALQRSSIT